MSSAISGNKKNKKKKKQNKTKQKKERKKMKHVRTSYKYCIFQSIVEEKYDMPNAQYVMFLFFKEILFALECDRVIEIETIKTSETRADRFTRAWRKILSPGDIRSRLLVARKRGKESGCERVYVWVRN